MKTFENNGNSIRENIAKMKLDPSIKFLLYNYLVCICAEEIDFCKIYDKPAR